MRGVIAGAIALAGAAALAWTHGAPTLIPLALGIGLGAVLWQSSFSFAGAWRRALTERRTDGVRAQCLLVGLSACLFLPALALGSVFGQPVRGFVFPVGMALILGAFLFGVGMQLGGGCGSGTLYGAGAGTERSWLTLVGFVAGATAAAATGGVWMDWPALRPPSLPDQIGTPAALLGTVTILALAALAAWRWEGTAATRIFAPAIRPRWSLGMGAILLSLLGLATLVAIGRPWAITAAFPLWGSKLIDGTGLDDPAFWPFWEDPTRAEALLRPILTDRTTLMDLGVIAGACLAATITRSAASPRRMPAAGPVVAALCGGGLMGIGAVMANGCNVSAWLGGVASGSPHGWVWIIAALAGATLGIRVRRWFGLT